MRFWQALERHGFGQYQWLRKRLGGHWERYREPHCANWQPWERFKPKCCTRMMAGMGDEIAGKLVCEEWPER
jgi:hypothetical protein